LLPLVNWVEKGSAGFAIKVETPLELLQVMPTWRPRVSHGGIGSRELNCRSVISQLQAHLLSGGFTQAAADFEPATIARPAIVDGALARLAHPTLEGDADGVGSFRPATRPQVKAPSRLHNR
jgi:hypothetical protein